MPDLWRRLGAPIAFGALALLAVLTMVSDRRAIRDDARDLPWWQAIVLEITVPVQKVLLAPVDTAKGAWARYVDLVGVRDENGELRGRIAELESAAEEVDDDLSDAEDARTETEEAVREATRARDAAAAALEKLRG